MIGILFLIGLIVAQLKIHNKIQILSNEGYAKSILDFKIKELNKRMELMNNLKLIAGLVIFIENFFFNMVC